MEVELLVRLMSWEIRVPHKPQMGFEARPYQGVGQASNTAGDATGPGIAVRAFKGKQMKLYAHIVSSCGR
jgi:hypothetical protein